MAGERFLVEIELTNTQAFRDFTSMLKPMGLAGRLKHMLGRDFNGECLKINSVEQITEKPVTPTKHVCGSCGWPAGDHDPYTGDYVGLLPADCSGWKDSSCS